MLTFMINLLGSANKSPNQYSVIPCNPTGVGLERRPVMYSFGGSEGQVIAHEAEQVCWARWLVRALRELQPKYMVLRGG